MVVEDGIVLEIALLGDCDGIVFNLPNDDGDENAFA